jgi:hypothetical protein
MFAKWIIKEKTGKWIGRCCKKAKVVDSVLMGWTGNQFSTDPECPQQSGLLLCKCGPLISTKETRWESTTNPLLGVKSKWWWTEEVPMILWSNTLCSAFTEKPVEAFLRGKCWCHSFRPDAEAITVGSRQMLSRVIKSDHFLRLPPRTRNKSRDERKRVSSSTPSWQGANWLHCVSHR